MMLHIFKKFIFVLVSLFVLFLLFYVFSWYGFTVERRDAVFGVTFSTVMSRQLGLEPRETLDAMADDLGAKYIRIPVYWTEVEPEKDRFVFDDYDYFIKKSEEKGIKLILVVGRKLPRWPECFEPEWTKNLESSIKNQELLKYIKAAVERYEKSPAVEAWQVENEPFFAFGKECAGMTLSSQEFGEEVRSVKELSSKPIITSDSGEQGFWVKAASYGDILGITMYRQSWSDFFGVSRFPFGPGFYRLKAGLFTRKPLWVVELQAEPWGPGKLLPEYALETQKELMNRDEFRKNVSYARRAGFERNYLWGAEWWFWLKEKQGDDSLWKEAQNVLIE